jgi:protein-tyrosine kinase
MGNILDTLRRTAPPSEPAALAEEPAFIEIGPKREVIAASPSVMASHPTPLPIQRPLPLAGPHSALFRALPARPSEVAVLRRPRFAPEIVAYHTPDLPIAARYAELYGSIREAAAAKAVVDHLVLLFAPVRPEIGSTTVLLNVAVVAARQGRRTLVVDANLRRPGVAARLGLTPSPGLMEVLAADCSIDEATRPTELERLYALTAGQSGPLLADVRTLHDLLGGLRERFDFVLIDGPRWDGRGTATAIASGCDAVFLVSPTSEADASPASDLARQLPQQGVRLAGSILTAR